MEKRIEKIGFEGILTMEKCDFWLDREKNRLWFMMDLDCDLEEIVKQKKEDSSIDQSALEHSIDVRVKGCVYQNAKYRFDRRGNDRKLCQFLLDHILNDWKYHIKFDRQRMEWERGPIFTGWFYVDNLSLETLRELRKIDDSYCLDARIREMSEESERVEKAREEAKRNEFLQNVLDDETFNDALKDCLRDELEKENFVGVQVLDGVETLNSPVTDRQLKKFHDFVCRDLCFRTTGHIATIHGRIVCYRIVPYDQNDSYNQYRFESIEAQLQRFQFDFDDEETLEQLADAAQSYGNAVERWGWYDPPLAVPKLAKKRAEVFVAALVKMRSRGELSLNLQYGDPYGFRVYTSRDPNLHAWFKWFDGNGKAIFAAQESLRTEVVRFVYDNANVERYGNDVEILYYDRKTGKNAVYELNAKRVFDECRDYSDEQIARYAAELAIMIDDFVKAEPGEDVVMRTKEKGKENNANLEA